MGRRRLQRLLWRISPARFSFERAQRRRLGTADQAIEFAVQIDDHYDRLSFLQGWLEGRLEEWGDYQPWISPLPPPQDISESYAERFEVHEASA